MPSTFLELVNRVNRKVNEVELTSGNFSSANGFYSTAKDAVNDSIRRINQQDFMWPFNHVSYDEALVAGTNRYDFQSDSKFAYMQTFRIQRDDTIGNETRYLREIPYEEYLQKYSDDEYNTATSIRELPRIVAQRPDSGYVVWPVPDEAYTLTYEYYSLQTDLSAYSDQTSVPSQFDHIIQDGAMVYVYNFRGDTETADRMNVQFKDKLDDMRKIYINRFDYVRDTRITRNVGLNQALRLGD